MHDINNTYTAPIACEKSLLQISEPGRETLSAVFYPGHPASAVCIIVPGFRSAGIAAPENMNLYTALSANGFPVLAYDYTMCRDLEPVAEDATFATHVADTKTIMQYCGQTPHILLSQSYGINIALASIDQNTKALVCALPAPDLIQRKILADLEKFSPFEKMAFDQFMKTNGFFFSRKKDSSIKLTQKFLESARQQDCQLDHLLQTAPYKPPVTFILNEYDNLSRKLGAKDLKALFEAHGFTAKNSIVPGRERHILFPETIEKIIDAVRDNTFIPDLALR